MRQFIVSLVLLFSVGTTCLAQKKNLDTSAYKDWQRMTNPEISYNGDWILYQYEYTDYLIHGKEKTTKYLYNRKTDKITTLSNVSTAAFFNQGKWLKYQSSATTPGGNDSTVLLRLKDGKRIAWERLINFTENINNPFIVFSYTIENKNEGKSTRVVSWNIDTGDSVLIDHIDKYTVYNNGNSIIYISNQGAKRVLMKGEIWGNKKVLYDDQQKPVADFALNKNGTTGYIDAASSPARLSSPDLLIAFSMRDGKKYPVLDYDDIQIPAGYRLGNRNFNVEADTKQLLIDVLPMQSQGSKINKTSDTSFDLELWTWNEAVSSRKQRPRMTAKSPVDYPQFIFNTDTKTLVQVKSDSKQFLIVPELPAFSYIFLMDTKPYEYSVDWKYSPNFDIYLINVRTGKRKLIEKDCSTSPAWSTNGKYAVWYNNKQQVWVKIDPVTAMFVDISTSLGYPVYDEEYDMPKDPPAYGLAGWSKDGTGVIIYDRYDLWMIDLEGVRPAYTLSRGYGRKNKVRLRLLEGNFIDDLDLSKSQLLRCFNETTKSMEVYRLQPGAGIQKLAGDRENIKIRKLSNDGRYCIWTSSSYSKPGDLWVSDISFSNRKQITRLNLQQQKYNWGTTRLFQWKDSSGKQNEGVIYLPENYDSTKSYPMIVEFYQIYSEEMNEYINPEYSTCVINVPTYTSNGFIIFRPDIHFTIGSPAESASSTIVSGTEALIKCGIADKSRVALQGHSWAGYLTAYIVTQTNIFACASPQALTVNTIADYSSVRASGAPCMFMYEVGQSRLGKNLWEDPEMYIRNSPIFFVDKIKTPLLIFHNDNDGAVDFSEGLALFLSMRRLQKPAWLLNYRKEGHTLDGRAAQMDWTIRMHQFFDHYLKGKSMPRWMKEGINIDERGKDQKFDY